MIYPALGDGIFYEGDENSMTIRWKTSKFDEPSFVVDVAIKLFPDGKIEFFYGNNITASTDWGSGVSVGDGNNYLITSISGVNNLPANFVAQINSTPFPIGMEITEDGLFQGTPLSDYSCTWNIPFKVTDYNRISSIKNLEFETLNVGINERTDETVTVVASPNPFAGQLSVNVTKNGIYHFELINITGNKVANVFSGHLNAGKSFTWDARNRFQPGVYFLTWTSMYGTGSEKLILLK